jgi:hypothetical protein
MLSIFQLLNKLATVFLTGQCGTNSRGTFPISFLTLVSRCHKRVSAYATMHRTEIISKKRSSFPLLHKERDRSVFAVTADEVNRIDSIQQCLSLETHCRSAGQEIIFFQMNPLLEHTCTCFYNISERV